jgi:hypothetical protein
MSIQPVSAQKIIYFLLLAHTIATYRFYCIKIRRMEEVYDA